METAEFLIRWGHYVFGTLWMGLLYYFNLVHSPYVAMASEDALMDVNTKLVPRSMLWFRHGALLTFLTGAALLLLLLRREGWQHMPLDILVGSAVATVMVANVWFIIWPNRALVIRSNESERDGGVADPRATLAARKAFMASRTNTLLSAPTLMLMLSNSHFTLGAPRADDDGSILHVSAVALIANLALVAVIEANAIWGRPGPLLTSIPAVIASSFLLGGAMAFLIAML